MRLYSTPSFYVLMWSISHVASLELFVQFSTRVRSQCHVPTTKIAPLEVLNQEIHAKPYMKEMDRFVLRRTDWITILLTFRLVETIKRNLPFFVQACYPGALLIILITASVIIGIACIVFVVKRIRRRR